MSTQSENQQAVAQSLPSIQAVSFDLDDTLWDCASAINKAEEVLYAWHEEFTPEITVQHTPDTLLEYRARVRAKHPELAGCVTAMRLAGLKSLLSDFGYSVALAEQAFEVFYKARSEVVLYDGVVDMLGTLKQRYKLAAITNGNADLEQIGIARYFDAVYAADLTLQQKPHADMFERCLSHFRLSAAQMLHIGDNPVTDIGGGHNASVQTLWFNPYNEPWPEHLAPPHYQVQQLSQIVQLLA